MRGPKAPPCIGFQGGLQRCDRRLLSQTGFNGADAGIHRPLLAASNGHSRRYGECDPTAGRHAPILTAPTMNRQPSLTVFNGGARRSGESNRPSQTVFNGVNEKAVDRAPV